MKRIAIIEDGYVRDVQLFAANPDIIEKDPRWEDSFRDVKYPCLYLGIFEGASEEEIKNTAAESLEVHADIISLVDCTDSHRLPMKPETDGLDDNDYVLCPACGGNLKAADDDYFGDPAYCSDCGQMLDWKINPGSVDNPEDEENGK